MTDLISLPTGNLTEMQQLLVTIKEELPSHLELQEINAKILWAKYESLMEEGFTDIQALELCKT